LNRCKLWNCNPFGDKFPEKSVHIIGVAVIAIGANSGRGNWGWGKGTARIICKCIEKCHFPVHNIGAIAEPGKLDRPARESRKLHPQIIVNELDITMRI